MAERARLGVGQEMAPFDKHVGRDREVETGVGPRKRAIVADPEQRTPGRTIEVPLDKFELVQAMLRERATSSGRSAWAIFSSTPLTKR